MVTVTLVPLSRGNEPILNLPPNIAARSRIPSNPMDCVLVISAWEIPRPLSLTSKII